MTTGAFFVVGISAFHLLRNKTGNLDGFRASMRISLIVGTVAVLATMGFGHLQGQRMADTQPMKLAAAEGLWNAEDPAGLSMFQIGNEADRTSIINIRIPSLLSFDTYIGEGGRSLSGGERQRIALARVLLKNVSFLILDEATANLDVETEHAVMETVLNVAAGRSLLIFTHRHIFLNRVDQVYVMRQRRLLPYSP